MMAAGQVFFWSWPTWAKLSFVLGNSLVIVLTLAGFIKLWKYFKIQRLSKEQAGDIERADLRLHIRSSDEIPFGAKAMLEDPEIEGVWNSRASTPLQSPVLAPRNSSPSRLSLNPFSRSRRNSSVSSFSHFRLPDPESPHAINGDVVQMTSNEPAAIASRAAPPNFKRTEDADAYHNANVATPDDAVPRRRSVTIRGRQPSEILVDPPFDDGSRAAWTHRASIRRSRVVTDPVPSTPKHERRGRILIVNDQAKEPPLPENTPTTRRALDRMEAHRKFHAAESGQLPRRHRNANNRSLGHKYSASDNFVLEPETTRAVSWPISSGEVLVDFTAPQKVQTLTSPQVVPFRAFVEMHPPPDPTPIAPPSAWTKRTQGLLDEKLEAQANRKRITISNNHSGKTARGLYTLSNHEQTAKGDEVSVFHGRNPRKVNQGFEVLPAGTAEQVHTVKDFGYSREPLREASNESKPRKLQKRNRSASRSRRDSMNMSQAILVT